MLPPTSVLVMAWFRVFSFPLPSNWTCPERGGDPLWHSDVVLLFYGTMHPRGPEAFLRATHIFGTKNSLKYSSHSVRDAIENQSLGPSGPQSVLFRGRASLVREMQHRITKCGFTRMTSLTEDLVIKIRARTFFGTCSLIFTGRRTCLMSITTNWTRKEGGDKRRAKGSIS